MKTAIVSSFFLIASGGHLSCASTPKLGTTSKSVAEISSDFESSELKRLDLQMNAWNMQSAISNLQMDLGNDVESLDELQARHNRYKTKLRTLENSIRSVHEILVKNIQDKHHLATIEKIHEALRKLETARIPRVPTSTFNKLRFETGILELKSVLLGGLVTFTAPKEDLVYRGNFFKIVRNTEDYLTNISSYRTAGN